MQKRILKITTKQRYELEAMRDHHATAYLRERAAALLKIADGMSVHAVAHGGLLRRHKPDTVYGWLNTFQEQGIAGLYQRPRRGKKILGRGCEGATRAVASSPAHLRMVDQSLDTSDHPANLWLVEGL